MESRRALRSLEGSRHGRRRAERRRGRRGRPRWAGALALGLAWTVAAIAAAPAVPAASPLAAQEAAVEAPPQTTPGDFSLQRLHGTDDFQPEGVDATWLDGDHWATLEADSAGTPELWRVEATTGRRERLVAASELVPDGASEPIGVEEFRVSPDGTRLLLLADARSVWRYSQVGTYWLFGLEDRTLRPLSDTEGDQMLAKFSPDGSRVAFVRDHDLFVVDLGSGEERRLTDDGGEDIINGTTDWVYEEELTLWDGYRWSPDGRRIAYWKFDQGPIPRFYMVDETALYPELMPVRYPKAGTDNSRVRVGSLELAGGETTWFDVECANDCYVARMQWAESPTEVAIQVLNRHQNRLDLRLGDATTGETRSVVVDRDSAWVNVSGPFGSPEMSAARNVPAWLDGGERFLWTSERDGWNHVYLYERDGTLVRQVTEGPWEVTSLDGVDEEAGVLYATAAYESPLTRQLLRVPLEGGEPEVVLGGRGVHAASFSPDLGRFIHTHSTVETPPVTDLRGADGRRVRVLEDNAALRARLDSVELGSVEFTTVEAADGTPLNAWMIRPPGFDPERRHGVLLYVYGGPGSQTVVDAWGGSRYLWHQYMARQGVIVASVDNRGTGARGRAFTKQVYTRLGQLETADQLAAVEQLGRLSYVDPDRIGIWGWSYGGYMTLMTTLLGGDAVAAGASVAPVTHWKLYDTIYTERYMRTPEENPEGYEEGAPQTHAAKLESPLLLVHGTGDDNVHFQNTLQMVHALERAGKQFELRIYPNAAHAISGEGSRVNLYGMMTDFLLEELRPEGARGPAATGASTSGSR